jgi:hypothetical protein
MDIDDERTAGQEAARARLLADAQAYGAHLRSEGRDHSVAGAVTVDEGTLTTIRVDLKLDQREISVRSVTELMDEAFEGEMEHNTWARLEQILAEGHSDASNFYYFLVDVWTSQTPEHLRAQMAMYLRATGFEPEPIAPVDVVG